MGFVRFNLEFILVTVMVINTMIVGPAWWQAALVLAGAVLWNLGWYCQVHLPECWFSGSEVRAVVLGLTAAAAFMPALLR